MVTKMLPNKSIVTFYLFFSSTDACLNCFQLLGTANNGMEWSACNETGIQKSEPLFSILLGIFQSEITGSYVMLYLAFWGTAKMFCAAFLFPTECNKTLNPDIRHAEKNSNLVKDLNLNPKTIKLLEKNREKSFWHFCLFLIVFMQMHALSSLEWICRVELLDHREDMQLTTFFNQDGLGNNFLDMRINV